MEWKSSENENVFSTIKAFWYRIMYWVWSNWFANFHFDRNMCERLSTVGLERIIILFDWIQAFWDKFGLLDTDSGILIQIYIYLCIYQFVLHLIQNHAIWYKNMQFDTESTNSLSKCNFVFENFLFDKNVCERLSTVGLERIIVLFDWIQAF